MHRAITRLKIEGQVIVVGHRHRHLAIGRAGPHFGGRTDDVDRTVHGVRINATRVILDPNGAVLGDQLELARSSGCGECSVGAAHAGVAALGNHDAHLDVVARHALARKDRLHHDGLIGGALGEELDELGAALHILFISAIDGELRFDARSVGGGIDDDLKRTVHRFANNALRSALLFGRRDVDRTIDARGGRRLCRRGSADESACESAGDCAGERGDDADVSRDHDARLVLSDVSVQTADAARRV